MANETISAAFPRMGFARQSSFPSTIRSASSTKPITTFLRTTGILDCFQVDGAQSSAIGENIGFSSNDILMCGSISDDVGRGLHPNSSEEVAPLRNNGALESQKNMIKDAGSGLELVGELIDEGELNDGQDMSDVRGSNEPIKSKWNVTPSHRFDPTWDLHQNSINLFADLLPILATNGAFGDHTQALQGDIGRLYLWGEVFGDGRLETIFMLSDELRSTVLELITTISTVLIEGESSYSH
jgi:hypothetical protein